MPVVTDSRGLTHNGPGVSRPDYITHGVGTGFWGKWAGFRYRARGLLPGFLASFAGAYLQKCKIFWAGKRLSVLTKRKSRVGNLVDTPFCWPKPEKTDMGGCLYNIGVTRAFRLALY